MFTVIEWNDRLNLSCLCVRISAVCCVLFIIMPYSLTLGLMEFLDTTYSERTSIDLARQD